MSIGWPVQAAFGVLVVMMAALFSVVIVEISRVKRLKDRGNGGVSKSTATGAAEKAQLLLPLATRTKISAVLVVVGGLLVLFLSASGTIGQAGATITILGVAVYFFGVILRTVGLGQERVSQGTEKFGNNKDK